MKVVPIPQLADNYAYLVIDEPTRQAGVVDCAEADKVLDVVAAEGVDLIAVLPTHHHWDHVGGNEDLVAALPELRVYGYRGEGARVPRCTTEVAEGDRVRIGDCEARVLYIPAHTSGHIAYYFEEAGVVFTGDTLFAGGCGRLFEGDAKQMMRSLSKLTALPEDTRVYFGHEYTEKNLRFALTLEPGNTVLREKHHWAEEQARHGESTVPTTIASELQTNPFLRWASPELRRNVEAQTGRALDDVATFAAVRALKDAY